LPTQNIKVGFNFAGWANFHSGFSAPAPVGIADSPALAYDKPMKAKPTKPQPRTQKSTKQARQVNAGLIIWQERKPIKTPICTSHP
jgi:hypothetical protein